MAIVERLIMSAAHAVGQCKTGGRHLTMFDGGMHKIQKALIR